MLIYPTLHYQNGGLMINDTGETDLSGLYAAGEVTGGVHGRNRLMGNSLLDILVFGKRAGMRAAEFVKGTKSKKSDTKLNLKHIEDFEKALKIAKIKEPTKGPMLLPDYTPDHVRARRWINS
jgi:succinate dehydrogenase/fumarate reductase flavoprotein subunit